MIARPILTDELLRQLGEEIGQCDFTSEHQKEFLARVDSCDVQAAPGNGKTTLLVAKLALLSRTWASRRQGVCVISHTNAARREVENRLSDHSRAAAFLSYPHFIGTVTAFIDQFIALPYLRGLGWPIRRIDDDVFAAVATARIQEKAAYRAYQQKHRLDGWSAILEVSSDQHWEPGPVPDRLEVKHRPGQPGGHTRTGAALEQLKSELARDGFYRFGDMTAIAVQAIARFPVIIERLRDRFPLVILDEAQDTRGEQLRLLTTLFGERVGFQKLGDQNQTLYEDDEGGDGWHPAADAIPLNETRRFGAEIAAFASRLTVRRPQEIAGRADMPSRRTLLLFDRHSIARVLPMFAEEIRGYYPQPLPAEHEAWVVASRHKLHRQPGGSWPKSLTDYHPEYRAAADRGRRPGCLCSVMRKAALKYSAHDDPREVMNLVEQGLAELMRISEYAAAMNQRVHAGNVWRVLAGDGKRTDLVVRSMIYGQVLQGVVTWDQTLWGPFVNALAASIGIAVPDQGALVDFLSFNEEGIVQPGGGGARTSFMFGGIQLSLGSIHSVKGRTVDSILIVETEVFKGSAANRKAMDLAAVLPQAFGIGDIDLDGNEAHLSAATNVFVGATRAKSLLALGVRKEAVTADLIERAREQGWNVRDVTGA